MGAIVICMGSIGHSNMYGGHSNMYGGHSNMYGGHSKMYCLFNVPCTCHIVPAAYRAIESHVIHMDPFTLCLFWGVVNVVLPRLYWQTLLQMLN